MGNARVGLAHCLEAEKMKHFLCASSLCVEHVHDTFYNAFVPLLDAWQSRLVQGGSGPSNATEFDLWHTTFFTVLDVPEE
jgi:hypothetical protein